MDEIRPLAGTDADEAVLRQRYEVFAGNRAEVFPGFPTTTFQAFAARCRRPAAPGRPLHRAWGAWNGDRLLGVGTAVHLEGEHADWVMPSVDVRPEHRRRGLGTALLRAILDDARAQGRGMLVQEQVRIGAPGEAWARAVGFAEVLRNSWQMLHVPTTDPALWDVPAPTGFRIEQWLGAAPERLVAAFAAARNAMGDAPTGESGYEAPVWTVPGVRAEEARAEQAGEPMRYAVAVHERTGAVAALTGMLVLPPHVELVWQRDTAVAREFRGLGLGRVVKAAMMRGLLAEHPALTRVITTTAARNAAMIRVNERIGYTRWGEFGLFEASVGRLGETLDAGLCATAAAAVPLPRTAGAADPGTTGVPGPRHRVVRAGAKLSAR